MAEGEPGGEDRSGRSYGSGRVVAMGCVSDLNIVWHEAETLGLAAYEMHPAQAGDIENHLQGLCSEGCKSVQRNYLASPHHVYGEEILAGRLFRDRVVPYGMGHGMVVEG